MKFKKGDRIIMKETATPRYAITQAGSEGVVKDSRVTETGYTRYFVEFYKLTGNGWPMYKTGPQLIEVGEEFMKLLVDENELIAIKNKVLMEVK